MQTRNKASDLLKLLNDRQAWNLPEPYRMPHYDAATVTEAVQLERKADDSDPYAGARMRLYLNQGYDLPSDVAKSAQDRIKARQVAHAFDPLEKIKRKMDEDRAWNQHNSAEFLKHKKKEK